MQAVQYGGLSLEAAAAKAGMSENTARKYRRAGQYPSALQQTHTWRTRADPFADLADEIAGLLAGDPSLQSTTLLEHFQEKYPDRFSAGQLRSLQRRIKSWRATAGPDKEIFFSQEHHPGDLSESDFCHAGRLHVTIASQQFDHLLYHFVLTYSNWEFARVCFSESFESLAEGLSAALTTLGGSPRRHRTDSLTAAVHNRGDTAAPHRECSGADKDEFTDRYRGLMRHYRIEAQHTQPRSPNENGDVEQSHSRTLTRLDQALMLRGSRNFETRADYEEFLRKHLEKANRGRAARFAEEQSLLQPLPNTSFDCTRRLVVRVSPGSTIRVLDNIYSVPSRLIGEQVMILVRSEQIEVCFGQKTVARLPRLRGKKGYSVDYRHVINGLLRKPGAFENYVYLPALFPSSWFRMAYDQLVERLPARGKKEYLRLLHAAAHQGQEGVEEALRRLMESGQVVSVQSVLSAVAAGSPAVGSRDISIAPVRLTDYDALLSPHSPSSTVAVTRTTGAQEVAHA